jgi:CRP/FNR family transcriptional regulator
MKDLKINLQAEFALNELSHIDIFRNLPSEDLTQLDELLSRKTFPAGKSPMSVEQTGEVVYFILDGRVKIHVEQEDGADVIISILGPGEIIGEMSALDQTTRSASVITLEETTVFWMDRDAFRHCLNVIPTLACNLACTLSARLRSANEQIQSLSAVDTETRIARRIIAFAERYGQKLPDGTLPIPIRLTQTDIANLVGASREHTNKILVSYKRARIYLGRSETPHHHSQSPRARRSSAVNSLTPVLRTGSHPGPTQPGKLPSIETGSEKGCLLRPSVQKYRKDTAMKFNQFSKAITVSLVIVLLAIAGITAISNPEPQKDSSSKPDKGRSATQKIAANPLDGGKEFKCLSGPDKCYCRGDEDCNNPLDPANKYLYHSFVESPEKRRMGASSRIDATNESHTGEKTAGSGPKATVITQSPTAERGLTRNRSAGSSFRFGAFFRQWPTQAARTFSRARSATGTRICFVVWSTLSSSVERSSGARLISCNRCEKRTTCTSSWVSRYRSMASRSNFPAAFPRWTQGPVSSTDARPCSATRRMR